MGCLYKCSVVTVVLAVLLAVAPIMYKQIDQREYNRRTTAEEAANGVDFTNKIVIVTGSSSGIGIATSKVLLENGATVIMACRNKQKALKVRKEILQSVNGYNDPDIRDRLKVEQLNLASLSSIDSFVNTFQNKYKQLNILINNAGVMGFDNYTLTKDGIEAQFGINHIGHFYLTQKLTDLLTKTAADSSSISRVILLTSVGANMSPISLRDWLVSEDNLKDKSKYVPMLAYGFSKACNVIYANEYNKRYSSDGVYAVSVHPGAIKTGLQKHNFWLGLWNKYVPDIGTKTVTQGASTTIRCASMSDDEFKENSGEYFEDCNVAKLPRYDIIDSGESSDELAQLLWDLSERIIKEKGFKL